MSRNNLPRLVTKYLFHTFKRSIKVFGLLPRVCPQSASLHMAGLPRDKGDNPGYLKDLRPEPRSGGVSPGIDLVTDTLSRYNVYF